MAQVYVGIEEYGIEGVDLELIQFIFDVVVSMAKLDEESEVGVVLTSDKHMQELNLRYRGKDNSTNILSFGYLETSDEEMVPPEDENYLGDIFMSRTKVLEEAEKDKISPKERFTHLLVHGFLHLAGMHHGTEAEAEEMEELEDKILSVVNAA